MTKEIVFVKLGGSLLTDKTRHSSPRLGHIERIAREVDAAKSVMSHPLVLGHGSGSFGHVAAIRSGLVSKPGDPRAISKTQEAAACLHRLVVRALLDCPSVAPFSVPPSAAFTATSGRLAAGAIEPLVRALDAGMVPVVYGDVVVDRRFGSAICSTEEVFRFLAARLRRHQYDVSTIYWVGETDGVLDRSGATIPVIDHGSWRQVQREIGTTRGTDVTGGMLLRLRMCRVLAAKGIESRIVNGTVDGLLQRALEGREVNGTVVRARTGNE